MVLGFSAAMAKGKTVSQMSDNYCEKFCRNSLWLIGARDSGAWTPHSILVSVSLLLSFVNWTYSCIRTETYDLEVFHHLSLNVMGTGLVLICLRGYSDILAMGKMADRLHPYWDQEMKSQYQKLRSGLFKSGAKRMADVFTVLTVGLWTNILRKNWQEGMLGSKLRLPSGMLLPVDSSYFVVVAHLVETMFIVAAVIVDLVVMKVFVVLSLQISVQFRTLSLALNGISESNARQRIVDCVRHHQDILRCFENLKSFYGAAFHFIYFGMIWAIALCRSIVLQDHIDFVNLLVLLVLEIVYLLIYCSCADEIVQASDSIGLAVYSSDWTTLPRRDISSLILIMMRCSKPPTIRLFLGGSPASQETITLVVNATLTFFMVSLLLK